MTTMKKAYIRPEATLIRIATTQILASSRQTKKPPPTCSARCAIPKKTGTNNPSPIA